MQTEKNSNKSAAREAGQSELERIKQLSESRRQKLAICVRALLDVQHGYQQLFDAMPVAWQTYDNFVSKALESSGVLDTDGADVLDTEAR